MQTHRVIAALVILSALLPNASRVAECQDRPDSVLVARVTPSWTIGSINVQLGSARLGLSELNATLTSGGRPALSSSVGSIGASGYARFGRLVLGASGESSLPQRATAAGWLSTFSFGSAMLDAGVVLVDGPHFLVYPQVSLGIRKTTLRVEQHGEFTYHDGVQDPARGVSLSSTAAMAGIGLATELHLSTRRTGAFALGLRAGVVRPIGTPSTSAGETDVTGSPRENTGSYLRLSIGKPIGRRRETFSTLSTALLTVITR